MTQKINVFPGLRQHTQRVTLDGSIYRITLTWRDRVSGWYMDLFDVDDVPISVGRRLSPGWSPMFSVLPAGRPPGTFIVVGEPDYGREDLGENLELFYLTVTELADGAQSVVELESVTLA